VIALVRQRLWVACYEGRGRIVRALLESGADPTNPTTYGSTPMEIAKAMHQGRGECVEAVEVRLLSFSISSPGPPVLSSGLRRWVLSRAWWQGAEKAYQLWKARQVADRQGSGAVAVRGGAGGQEKEEGEAVVDWVVHGLKGDLFPGFMEYMG
jgi:hypothetical protein